MCKLIRKTGLMNPRFHRERRKIQQHQISLNDQLPPVENQGNFKSQLPQVEPDISLNDQLPPVENQGNFKSQPPQVEPDISLNNQPSPVENQGNPNSQPPQVQQDISLNSQLSSVENQGNPIKQDVTQKVALLGDDDIPSFPWPGGSQGEMNIGGPNPIEMLEQNVQQSVQSVKKVWNSWFNPKTEPKPECAKRVIPYGAPKLSDMFPFCCEKPFTYMGGPRKGFTGDPEQRRLSLLERQVGKAGFYCRDYYDQYGNPGADARPEPASNTPKREVIPITKMLRYNANAGARSGRLSPRYAKAPHTCTADFLKYEGLTPSVRKKKPPPGAEPEPEEPPEYEDYRPEDEYDDEDDFVVPEGWNSDPRHISPNQ
ncbi:hypothetical protein MMC22_009551 [Lobaria immixta]|nr:hypothetical protein [Lobaria immixta]